MDFVAIDFEIATGKRNSACAIGMAEIEGGEIIKTHYTLIKPPENKFDDRMIYGNRKYPGMTYSGHNVTPLMTKNEKTFAELWPWILSIIDGKTIAAHNASFDISVLNACIEHYAFFKPSIQGVICSCNAAKKGIAGLENYRLSTVAKYFNIALEHHYAESDARVCAEIILKIIQLNPESVELRNYDFDSQQKNSKSASRKNWYTNIDLQVMEEFDEYDVFPDNDNRFAGMTFVFTGELEALLRKDAKTIAEFFGGNVSNSVSRKVTHLVIGPDQEDAEEKSDKHKKALALIENSHFIQIWTEAEFLLRTLTIEQNDLLQGYEFAFIGEFIEDDLEMMRKIVSLFGASFVQSTSSETRVIVLGKNSPELNHHYAGMRYYNAPGHRRDLKIYNKIEFCEAMQQCAETVLKKMS